MLVGTVYDTATGARLRLVTVRVMETQASALTDDAGHYRVTVPAGLVHLRVRHIGYEPAALAVNVAAGSTFQDVYLHPAPIPLAPVTVTAVEDPAPRIIAGAIARKHQLFHGLHDYRYTAYVKFAVRDVGKPPDSASSVLLITETRTTAYWQQPDRYQETILARRQSSNLNAEQNLVTVGEIVNFNRDRVDLRKYSLVSPIADDALEYYDYRVLDTLVIDGRSVFQLALRPKSDAAPLFAGVIDIADSTYDVLAIDVGVNRTVRFNFVRNLRYRQRLRDMGGGRWMPYEIQLAGEVHIGVPLPGFPSDLAFEHAASLADFRFDEGHPPRDLREVRVVVSDAADHPDDSVWVGPRAIPLSVAESSAWTRIDSVAHQPPGLGARVRTGVDAAIFAATDPDFFHFERVDGTYLGAGHAWRATPDLTFDTKLGYATGSEHWQYRGGARLRLSEPRRIWAGAWYHDETVSRPTFVSRAYNPTYRALMFRLDPLDYYRERGLTLALGAKLFDFTSLAVRYDDQRETSLPVVTDYSIFSARRPQRPNPVILDGTLRSVSGTLSYDTRSMLRLKDGDVHLPGLTWTRVTLGAEIAAHDVLHGDFSFRRYSLLVERRQRTLNLGITTIVAAAGIATGWVPPQRYFAVDFGMRALTFQAGGFNTPGDTNYTGTRAGMVTVRHDFDRLLFAKSGLPLIRTLPFTLSVHGGVFWTEFHAHPPNPGDSLLVTAPRPYVEAGFGLGNLTPFLSPFNLALHVTWQLSSYPTRRSQFGLGFTRS
ncbi:MAG TPA: DUF5686 family protein [Gemmatimonadales bacterium]|nr:DUF5686 family protein [Gemmatimonadales bacterium]